MGLLLALSLALRAGAAAGAGPVVDVPVDHWAYGLLERFEAKGLLHGLGDGIKPFTRAEMAHAVAAVASRAQQGWQLTPGESAELGRLQEELEPELSGLGRTATAAVRLPDRLRTGRPLLHYRTAQGQLWGDLLFRQQTDLFVGLGRDAAERMYRNRLGGVAWGDYAARLGYRISFEQTREQGTRRYDLRDDVFERRLEVPQLKGGLADYHEGTAFLGLTLAGVEIGAGKGEVSWGPAPEDNLGLGHRAPSFDQIRVQARYGALKLVSITGFLQPCPDRPDSPLCNDGGDPSASYVVNGMSRSVERRRHLAAHRVEAAVAPWLDLGFQEAVVYGDRGLQPAYVNPVMFYWAAQSYLGDQDNALLGLDLDLHPGRGWRVYAAYLADDLKKARALSNDFANKFAVQVGCLWVDPLGWRDVDLRAEYVRIEPWVYTHKYPINTFRHFDAPLGYPMDPNSDQWRVRLSRRLGPAVTATAEVGRRRHGANQLRPDGTIRNVGGDLNLGWRPEDGVRTTKRFLDGRLERRLQVGGELAARLSNRGTAAARYVHEWDHDVPLPPRWGPGVALPERTGFGSGQQGHLSFELRYGYL